MVHGKVYNAITQITTVLLDVIAVRTPIRRQSIHDAPETAPPDRQIDGRLPF